MQQISPSLQSRIYNQSINNINLNQNTKLNLGLEHDVVELELKKDNSAKTAMKIGAGLGLVACVVLAILKNRDLSKSKEELSALYDAVFERLSKDSDYINFEKPKLVFKSLDKKTGAGYMPSENEIQIDPKYIRNTLVPKDMDKALRMNIADGLKITYNHRSGNLFDLFRKGTKDLYRLANKDESLAIQGSFMAHEIMHAKQFQLLLSSQSGKEKYIQKLKADFPDASEEVIKKIYPFVFNYQPKCNINDDIAVCEKLPDGSSFIYRLKNVHDAFVDYNRNNKFEYYTNLTEVSARNAECVYWNDVKNGKLNRSNNVSDEFLDYMFKCSVINTRMLMRAAKEKNK